MADLTGGGELTPVVQDAQGDVQISGNLNDGRKHFVSDTLFTSKESLQIAHPATNSGNYAVVHLSGVPGVDGLYIDIGVWDNGADNSRFSLDLLDTRVTGFEKWVGTSGVATVDVQGETDYTSGYVQGSNAALKISGNYTWGCEVNFDTLSVAFSTLWAHFSTVAGFSLYRNSSGTDFQFNVRDKNGAHAVNGGSMLTGVGFQKVLVVIEYGVAATLYVDGSQASQFLNPVSNGTAPTDSATLATDPGTPARFTDGQIRNLTFSSGAATNPLSWAPTNPESLAGTTNILFSSDGSGTNNRQSMGGWTETVTRSITPTTFNPVATVSDFDHAVDAIIGYEGAIYKNISGGILAVLSVEPGTDETQWLTINAQTVEQVLTDQANIAWDMRIGEAATVVLDGNRTLDNPTNLQAGKTYKLRVVQDAITGSRTLAYGSVFKFSGGAPTLSTGINDIDILWFDCDGTNLSLMVFKADFT